MNEPNWIIGVETQSQKQLVDRIEDMKNLITFCEKAIKRCGANASEARARDMGLTPVRTIFSGEN